MILRDVVLAYLRELGARVERGESSIAQEHFASCFLEDVADRASADVIVLAAALPDVLDAAADALVALRETHAVAIGGPATTITPPAVLGSSVLPADS